VKSGFAYTTEGESGQESATEFESESGCFGVGCLRCGFAILRRRSYGGVVEVEYRGRPQQKTGPKGPVLSGIKRPASGVSHQLDGYCGGFAAADTQAGHTAFAAGALERVDQGQDDP